MEIAKSKVYALPNAADYITRIDGGYTIGNITTPEDWMLIDEGYGDKYNLCQSNYLPKPLMDERGVYRYKLEEGQAMERTQEEMDGDYAARPVPATPKTNAELEAENALLKAQVQAVADRNEFVEDCIAEMAAVVYADEPIA